MPNPSAQLTHFAISKLFADESKLGVTNVDGQAVFPDGSAMANCTNCARRAIELVGRGEIWGYYAEENLGTEAACGQQGHDFALIDNRLLIDVWLAFFTGSSLIVVFDLEAPEHQEIIQRLYGDRSKWTRVE